MSLEGKATASKLLRGKINKIDVIYTDTYEIAVANGFEGTIDEWLASLKGEKGDKGDPAEGSVLYTEQELTEEQQNQARKNIGAVNDGFPDEIYDYVGDNCVHFTQQPTELTEEQKAQAWKNIGGLGEPRSPAFDDLGIYREDQGREIGAIIQAGQYEDLGGGYEAAVLEFYGCEGDELTILRNLAPPMHDTDAANKSYVDRNVENAQRRVDDLQDAIGEIETALDGILAIQNALIGGDNA